MISATGKKRHARQNHVPKCGYRTTVNGTSHADHALAPLAAVEPDREYVVMATRLLSRHRYIPAFVRSTQAIWPGLTRSDGLLGYSLSADVTRRTFCTLSVWRDGDAVEAFVRSEPHTMVVAKTRPWMVDSTFVTWTVRGVQLPVNWEQVRERFHAAMRELAAGRSDTVRPRPHHPEQR